MKRSFFSSLHTRMLIVVAMTAVPALALILYTNLEQRRLAILEAHERSVRLTQRVSDREESMIETTRLFLVALRRNEEIVRAGDAGCRSRLALALKERPVYGNLGVVNAEGDLLCSAVPVTANFSMAHRDWYKRAVQTREFSIGEFQVDPVTGKAVIVFAIPVLEENAPVKRVVFATLDLSWLNRFASENDLPAGSTITVIDRKGVILARYPDSRRWVGQSARETVLFQDVVLQGVTHGVDLNGERLLYALSELPSARGQEDVSVIVGIPQARVLAAANRTVTRNVLLLLLFASVAAVAAWMTSHKLVLRPVERLVDATRGLAGGDLRVRVGLPQDAGELGELGQAFDGMAANLERLDDERRQKEAALRESAQVTAAQAKVFQRVISSLNTPTILQQLVQVSTAALGCSHSYAYLEQPGEGVFRTVSGWGDTEEEWEARRVLEVPAAAVAALAREDVVVLEGPIPVALRPRPTSSSGTEVVLLMALRHGDALIGFQSAGYWHRGEGPTDVQRRIAAGISQAASMAMAHARLLEESQNASRVKTDFLTTMSHELRTPCHIIAGYVQLLLEGGIEPLTARQEKALRQVHRNVVELLELISTTLDLSRFEAGRPSLQIETFEFSDLVREVGLDSSALLEEKPHIELRTKFVGQPGLVSTDRRKLKVILKNLLNNAVKFTDEGCIRLEANREDNGISVRVSDTGIGIAPEVRPHVFDMFHQGDSSITRKYGGVGLGLYIAKRMVDLLGGTIGVESEEGVGSTFHFWFPDMGYRIEQSGS